MTGPDPTPRDDFVRRRYDPRLQLGATAAGGFAVAALGIALLQWELEGRLFAIPYLCIVLGVVIGVSGGLRLLRHRRLTLDATGFSIGSWSGSRRFEWCDLDSVEVDDAATVNRLMVSVRDAQGTVIRLEALRDAGYPVYRIRDRMLDHAGLTAPR